MNVDIIMRMFRRQIIAWGLLYGIILLMMSCSKIIQVDYDQIESKLVLQGRLSPQRGLEVLVYRTKNPYEWVPVDSLEKIYFVENAVVEIYHRDTLVDEAIHQGQSFYQSEDPSRISAGMDYSVRVSASGMSSVQVDQIQVPPEPPEVKNFKLTPFPDNGTSFYKRDTLFFEVKNRPEYTVFAVDVRYENYPIDDYDGFLEHFGESFDPCDGLYYFTNTCFTESWIERKQQYYFDRKTDRNAFFLISIIESKIMDFIEDVSGDGDDGFTEPPMHQGNVEGGFGYIVGENQVRFPYK